MAECWYYDPQTGRYISQDPIGLAGGVNRFSYVNHNPLNNFDSLGLWALGDPLDPTLVNFTAGFGDGMLGLVTFGFWDGNAARKLLDIGSVDSCSAEYGYGEIAGEITGSLILARAGPKKPNPCGFNSFTGETLVSVKPANAQQTEALNGKVELKPISQIVVGDEVLAFSEWRNKGEISNQDQRLSYEKVTDVYTSYKQQVLVHLSLDNGATITATEGHPFKTDEGWRDAIMLKKGGKLLLKVGGEEEAKNQLLLQPKVDDKNTLSATQSGLSTSDSTRTIIEIRLEKKVVAVYNLEVANAHTFFVGEDGVLVHNAIPAGCKNMPGVYMFIARSGKVYIGKAKDIAKRLAQHERSGKLPKGNMPTFKPMPGANDLQLSIVEQLNINFHGYAKSDRGILENSINSMSKARQRFYGLIP